MSRHYVYISLMVGKEPLRFLCKVKNMFGKGKRVSRAFFLSEKTFPFSRRRPCAKTAFGAHGVGIQGESRAKPGSGAHGSLQLMLLVCKMGCICTREEGCDPFMCK